MKNTSASLKFNLMYCLRTQGSSFHPFFLMSFLTFFFKGEESSFRTLFFLCLLDSRPGLLFSLFASLLLELPLIPPGSSTKKEKKRLKTHIQVSQFYPKAYYAVVSNLNTNYTFGYLLGRVFKDMIKYTVFDVCISNTFCTNSAPGNLRVKPGIGYKEKPNLKLKLTKRLLPLS